MLRPFGDGKLRPEYLKKSVDAAITAIEQYDKDGNNGLTYEEISEIPDLAVTEEDFKMVWDMNKDGVLDLAELITNVYVFALVQ